MTELPLEQHGRGPGGTRGSDLSEELPLSSKILSLSSSFLFVMYGALTIYTC